MVRTATVLTTRSVLAARCGERGVALVRDVDHPPAVPLQGLDRSGTERDAPGRVGLGVLLDQAVRAEHHSPADDHRSLVEVEVAPAESDELAAAGAGGRGQEHEGGELGIGIAGEAEEAGDVGGPRRVNLSLRDAGRAGVGGRIPDEPAPPHALSEGSAQDDVRPANSWPAPAGGRLSRRS